VFFLPFSYHLCSFGRIYFPPLYSGEITLLSESFSNCTGCCNICLGFFCRRFHSPFPVTVGCFFPPSFPFGSYCSQFCMPASFSCPDYLFPFREAIMIQSLFASRIPCGGRTVPPVLVDDPFPASPSSLHPPSLVKPYPFSSTLGRHPSRRVFFQKAGPEKGPVPLSNPGNFLSFASVLLKNVRHPGDLTVDPGSFLS